MVAFDATYKKNKCNCQFIVFSGVNHHNKTIIFASDVVSNEVEGICVWLLEQFLGAMKDKKSIYIITDDDTTMRNTIKRVFPNSYHRLCVWHCYEMQCRTLVIHISYRVSENACLVILRSRNLKNFGKRW